jgi:hypothetical protein
MLTIKQLIYLPAFFINWILTLRAGEKGAWSEVEIRVGWIHANGFATDESRFWLATAYANTARWQMARREFEAIQGVLSRDGWQKSRARNYVLSLMNVGDVQAAQRFLEAAANSTLIDGDAELTELRTRLTRHAE